MSGNDLLDKEDSTETEEGGVFGRGYQGSLSQAEGVGGWSHRGWDEERASEDFRGAGWVWGLCRREGLATGPEARLSW